jgi:hypothetical protein
LTANRNWLGHCEQCFAYFHWCPQQAVQYGYFVTFDEMTPDTPGDSAHLVWHPVSRDTAAGNLTTVTASQQYLATITGKTGADTGVKLAMFLATPPSEVILQDGIIAAFGTVKYLFASYSTDGPRTLVTVHYPGDATHAVPAFVRLTGSGGYTGARIGSDDYAVGGDDATSTNSTACIVSGVAVNAKAALFRKSGANDNDQISWYAAKGFYLKDSAGSPRGFSSDQEIMIQVNHQRGKLLAETNSVVTFYEPGSAGVLLNGQLAASVPVSGGFRCTVPAGEYDLTFISP